MDRQIVNACLQYPVNIQIAVMQIKIQIKPKNNEWNSSKLHPELREQFFVADGPTVSIGQSGCFLELSLVFNYHCIFTKRNNSIVLLA